MACEREWFNLDFSRGCGSEVAMHFQPEKGEMAARDKAAGHNEGL